jgi:quinone-modifying oxidoreductase subunit QmoB
VVDDVKVGAYLCRGCGLGERLNTEQLALIATREGKAEYAREHEFLCSQSGIDMIRADIDAGNANHVVIGACSRRAKTDAFRFDSVAMARASLREGVVWVRPDSDDARETTQEMADDYIRMACTEVRFMSVPRASDEQTLDKHLLVVGGGFTGLTAAEEASKAGYTVTIVEKSDRLGGFAAELRRRIPSRSPYAEPEEPGVAELVARVEADANIDVRLNATVARTSGAPGRFSVDIAAVNGDGATPRTHTFGAIIQASGFREYDAAQLTELAYADSQDVVTQAELEALARAAGDGPIKRPSDGRDVSSVAFVQCAGQRSDKPGHLAYCSGFCCAASIKQAMYFKDANPGVDTVVLYTDLRTPGSGGEDFYRSGQERGVIFSKAEVLGVSPGADVLKVRMHDLILGEETEMDADLVVLATGVVPNAGVDPDAVPLSADDDESEEAAPAAGSVEIPVDSILNLSYRQGTDVPQLAHGFADSHFI